jgi:hypothetical protein
MSKKSMQHTEREVRQELRVLLEGVRNGTTSVEEAERRFMVALENYHIVMTEGAARAAEASKLN